MQLIVSPQSLVMSCSVSETATKVMLNRMVQYMFRMRLFFTVVLSLEYHVMKTVLKRDEKTFMRATSIVLLGLTFRIRLILLSSEGEGTRAGQLLSSVHCQHVFVCMHDASFLQVACKCACQGVCVQSHRVNHCRFRWQLCWFLSIWLVDVWCTTVTKPCRSGYICSPLLVIENSHHLLPLPQPDQIYGSVFVFLSACRGPSLVVSPEWPYAQRQCWPPDLLCWVVLHCSLCPLPSGWSSGLLQSLWLHVIGVFHNSH